MNDFKFGDKVWHEECGLGVVVEVSDKIKVHFESGYVNNFNIYYNEHSCRNSSDLKPVSDWIEIDDSDVSTHPIDHQKVICFYDKGRMGEGVFNKEKVKFYNTCCGDRLYMVTHWRPLPWQPV